MRITALLDPQILEVKLLAIAIGPKEIGIPFESRNDVLVVDKGNDPLLLRPDAGAIGVVVLTQAFIKKRDPRRCSPGFEGFAVVMDLEQIAAGRTAVDNFQKAKLARAAPDALKPSVIVHR